MTAVAATKDLSSLCGIDDRFKLLIILTTPPLDVHRLRKKSLVRRAFCNESTRHEASKLWYRRPTSGELQISRQTHFSRDSVNLRFTYFPVKCSAKYSPYRIRFEASLHPPMLDFMIIHLQVWDEMLQSLITRLAKTEGRWVQLAAIGCRSNCMAAHGTTLNTRCRRRGKQTLFCATRKRLSTSQLE